MRLPRPLSSLLLLGALAPGLQAQDRHGDLSDLTFTGFFSEGWDQDWSHRQRSTPDMALLRVTTNFLEREFRLDLSRTDLRNHPTLDSSDFANALIAYAPNRRFMLELIQNVQWNRDHQGNTVSGSGGGGLARFQLVDAATRTLSFQAKLALPNKGLGQTQTSVAYGLAGWQDLGALWEGFGRTGLYGSVQLETLNGPSKPGARTRTLTGTVSLARTWTDPNTRGIRNFTTFAEFTAQRDEDGPAQGRTFGTFTPGIRTWLIKGHSLTLGEDLPLGARGPAVRVLRLTYIFNF